MFTTLDECWKRAIDYHGHACPGLAIGCRLAYEAAEFLELENAAEDEELVCITESDACCLDAVQAILGCTMGKGNLLLKLRGKAAFSFFVRDKKACRIIWLGNRDENLSRDDKIALLLSPQAKDLFSIKPVANIPPPLAILCRSIACAKCGERTAELMMRSLGGKLFCQDCLDNYSRIL